MVSIRLPPKPTFKSKVTYDQIVSSTSMDMAFRLRTANTWAIFPRS